MQRGGGLLREDEVRRDAEAAVVLRRAQQARLVGHIYIYIFVPLSLYLFLSLIYIYIYIYIYITI